MTHENQTLMTETTPFPRPATSRTADESATAATPQETAGRHAREGAKPGKPLRFKIGVALLILYPFFYLAIPIAPLLPLDGGMKVAVAGGVVAVGEVVLLVAIALMGKEAYQAIKTTISNRVSRKAGK